MEDNRVVFIYLFSSNSQPQLFSLSRHKEILNQLAPGKKMTSSSLLASGWVGLASWSRNVGSMPPVKCIIPLRHSSVKPSQRHQQQKKWDTEDWQKNQLRSKKSNFPPCFSPSLSILRVIMKNFEWPWFYSRDYCCVSWDMPAAENIPLVRRLTATAGHGSAVVVGKPAEFHWLAERRGSWI